MTVTKDYKKGINAALFCAVLWGLLPLYWQSLKPIDSSVIIFYRIFLVGAVCFIASAKIYGIKEILKPWKDRKLIIRNILAGILITCNWSLYIWAVNADHVIQTCIGYYIEPLMVCVFGVVFFKEKLEKHKVISLAAAGAGLVVLLLHFKQMPFIALGLAVTFATYAAIKKTNTMPALVSLFYETVFLMPFALGFVIYLEVNGKGALGIGEPYQYVLLLLCGIMTAVPLGLFAFSAQLVPLTTLGIIEYISPSLALIIGIFILNEPFDMIQLISFVIIWIGLVFFTLGERKAEKKEEDTTLFENFEGHDRFDFPDGIVRVTAGRGGEALLITKDEKTALIDCGMAYCGREVVLNIEKALEGRNLDYVFLTHTHYDHIGALPFIRKRWPLCKVVASSKASKVFKSEGAVNLIKKLGEEARNAYSVSSNEIPAEGFAVDIIVKDADNISIGKSSIKILETKGHTDCSLCYVLEPEGIMFASESTGVLEEGHNVHSAILKSYDESIRSAVKCRDYGASRIIIPHYGIIPEFFNEEYFRLFIEGAADEREFVKLLYEKGYDDDKVLSAYTDRFWNSKRGTEQPKEAFMVNAVHIIRVLKNS